MCGIAGTYDLTASTPAEVLRDRAGAMNRTLRHRGPDDAGIWWDARWGIALGQTRLAIRDLSAAGHQPMVSSCGRFVLVYNGEIYSQEEIARDLDLAGRRLRGHSDTEVILEACAEWGVDRTVERLIGMFAFALFDRESGELTLARDRMGIKPLFWAMAGRQVAFASELTALRDAGTIPLTIDRNAIASFLRYAYVPAPYSIYTDVRKLMPGTIVSLEPGGSVRERSYWSVDTFSRGDREELTSRDESGYLDALDELLGDAVRRRLVSDVPLGALLSGGVDSSLVAALMVEQSAASIRTFTIGFDEAEFDEATHARAIANHLGTEHHELVARPRDAMDLVDQIPRYYDEPFADSSQLPTMLVSELTRREVTVVLSGDGGDELFGGYSRYSATEELWAQARRVPRALRRPAGGVLEHAPAFALDAVARLAPRRLRRPAMARRLRPFGTALAADDLGPMYRTWLSHWPDPEAVVLGGRELGREPISIPIAATLREVRDAMRREDQRHYLPDDILTKVDRASMRVGLEARVPLLDHRVVELSWRYPSELLTRDGQGKWPLRSSLYRRVPRVLVDRPKMGFGVPIGAWLRGPMRRWAEDLLDPTTLASQGLLDPAPIAQAWAAHLAGAPMEARLWAVLVLQSWLRENPGPIS